MKKRIIVNLVFTLFPLVVLAQIPPDDWLNYEIETKSNMLEKRWELSKSLGSGNRKDYDVGYYELDLGLDIPSKKIYGTVKIRGTSLTDNLSQIDLDLDNRMSVTDIAGDAISFNHSDGVLSLVLSENRGFGESFEVVIEYESNTTQLNSNDKGFFFSYHNGVPIVSTLNEPYFARTWFPCKDLPEDKADSVDIIVTVPDTLIAVSNGTLTEVKQNSVSTLTYHWTERYPITTYLISLAISNFVYWKDTYTGLDGTTMPVEYWVYPEDYNDAFENLSKTSEMIEFFAGLWGEYPFIKEKYGQAQFFWTGGMEHQTCTSLGRFDELLICHELAHQWWGDMVTCANWHEIWLNEGFARYSEALWWAHTHSDDELFGYMNYLDRPDRWQEGSVYIDDTTSTSSIFNMIVYDKGAWTLHMLRKVLGEEKFWSTLKEYRNAHYMDVVTTEDLKNVCEQMTGSDMDWFFDQWIFGSGRPHYQFVWNRRSARGGYWDIKIAVEQKQLTPTLFKMPLDVHIETDKGLYIFTVWDSLAMQEFKLKCPGKPTRVNLDPVGWVLKYVTDLTLNPDLDYKPTDFLLSNPYPNPFNRSVCFNAYFPYNTKCSIGVFDLLGREVGRIKSGNIEAGYYTDLKWQPENTASGIYMIRLHNDDINLVQKVLYLR